MLVAGNDYVSVGYAFSDNSTGSQPETLVVECTLMASTVGSCSGSAFGTPIATTQTTFTPFPVLVGTSAPPAPTSTAPPSPASSSVIVSSTPAPATTISATLTATSSAATMSKSNGAIPGNVGYASFVGLNLYVVMGLVGNML